MLSHTFGVFNRALVRNAFAFDQTPDQLIAPPGSIVTSTVTLNSFDEVAPLTFTLSAQSAWNVTLTPAQVSLKPCESRPITITVHIPPDGCARCLSADDHHCQLRLGRRVTSTVLSAKAPASVLLVEDDRWYPVDGAYRSALAPTACLTMCGACPRSWLGPEPVAPIGRSAEAGIRR